VGAVLALTMILKSINGDTITTKEILDRLEGKVVQPLALDANVSTPLQVMNPTQLMERLDNAIRRIKNSGAGAGPKGAPKPLRKP
jgi:hypothetical protein